MFSKLKKLWNKHGFEITLVGCIVLILVMSLFQIGKKGTWSRFYVPIQTVKKSRSPPTESKGEVECRRVLEEVFEKSFPKARPEMLRNPVTSEGYNSNNLELDCYNSELQLAVEYNGIQHYKYIPYFHRTRDAFQNQKYRDYMKRDLCKQNGITLIEVPYTVKHDQIETFLIDKLSLLGYNKWFKAPK